MDFHLFTICITYLFCILIIHLLIKNNLEDEYISDNKFELLNNKEMKDNVENEELEEINTEKDLIIDPSEILNLKMKKPVKKILSFKKKENDDAKNDLISYLDSEKQFENQSINQIVDNIESEKDKVEGNNYFESMSVSDFSSQNNITDKYFTNNHVSDTYSFDPVPTDEKDSFNNSFKEKMFTNLNNDENKPIFDSVAAFEDLDFNYAEF